MFKATASGIPEGQYRLRFTKWEQVTHEEFGERARFDFEVTDGQHKGATTSRFTGVELRAKTDLGKLIFKAMVGHLPNVGEEFNPDDHIGREFIGVVQENDSGSSTKITSLIPQQSAGDTGASPADAGVPF